MAGRFRGSLVETTTIRKHPIIETVPPHMTPGPPHELDDNIFVVAPDHHAKIVLFLCAFEFELVLVEFKTRCAGRCQRRAEGPCDAVAFLGRYPKVGPFQYVRWNR